MFAEIITVYGVFQDTVCHSRKSRELSFNLTNLISPFVVYLLESMRIKMAGCSVC